MRRLFLGIHATIAAVFSLLLVAGIWSGISDIRPPRKQPRASAAVCAEELARLHTEFQQRLAGFATARSSAQEGKDFERWVVRYRAEVASSRQRCSPPLEVSGEKAGQFERAFRSLLRSVDLSEVQATHWARHLGPALDQANEAIEEASRD